MHFDMDNLFYICTDGFDFNFGWPIYIWHILVCWNQLSKLGSKCHKGWQIQKNAGSSLVSYPLFHNIIGSKKCKNVESNVEMSV